MASYVTFILAGLYPVPSTHQYLIVSPFFPSISFTNSLLGTTTTIVSKGWNGNPSGELSIAGGGGNGTRTDGSGRGGANGKGGKGGGGTGGKNIFVKSVTINGEKATSNCFIDFEVFEKGGLVELEMSDDPADSTCGGGDGALPPSLSTGGF